MTRPLLQSPAAGEPSDAGAFCQYTGADRWTAASVGVAQAEDAKENDLEILPEREVSGRTACRTSGPEFLGPLDGQWGADGTIPKTILCRRVRLETNGCVCSRPGAKK